LENRNKREIRGGVDPEVKSVLLDDIVNKVQALHSYECPAIVAVPVTGGNPDYLEWLVRETGGAA